MFHLLDLSIIAETMQEWKAFSKQERFLRAKADNSVKWHNYKHSIFEDLEEVSDFSYSRRRNRTAIELWQISHSCNEKNMHSSEVLQTKSCAQFQGHMS